VSAALDTWRDRMNLVVFEPLALEQPWKLATYQSIGGYEAESRAAPRINSRGSPPITEATGMGFFRA